MKNKDYLTLANERHEFYKKRARERQELEAYKISARLELEQLKQEGKKQERKDKTKGAAVGALLGVIGFMALLGILFGFAMLISRT